MRLVPLPICGMNAAAAAPAPLPVWLAVLVTNRSFEKTNAEWFGYNCKRCREPKVTTSRGKDAHKQDKCNKLLTIATAYKQRNCNVFF